MPDRAEPSPEAAATPWRRLLERASELVAFRPREAIALGVLCIAVVAGAAFAYARSLPHGKPAPSTAASPLPGPSAGPSGSPGGTIFVHIAGAVRSPGVYELPAGSRVIDGVRAAGGAADGADMSAINLARALADGERVYIPRRGEIPPGAAGADPAGGGGGSGGGGSGKVNINTASQSQLEDLPGIGEVIAKRIVEYRDQHGPFHTTKDLLKVEGIGEKKFESIQDYVTV